MRPRGIWDDLFIHLCRPIFKNVSIQQLQLHLRILTKMTANVPTNIEMQQKCIKKFNTKSLSDI